MENKLGKKKDEAITPLNDSLESDPSIVSELSDSEPAKSAGPVESSKTSKAKRVFSPNNKFLLLFVLLLTVASAATFVSLNSAKKTNSVTKNKAQSLTTQQLADISGSTTTVGDAQQTLDVQSNAIFEGQVLLRNNLNVAGTIKVGGGLSLPSVTVGGTSTFGQAQINGTLSVAGDTNLQGQVTIEKNLTVSGSGSFGSLSTGQLSITNLQLTGDLTITRHIAFSGGTPARSNGSALGGGGTASVNGGDSGGTVTINTGSSPSAGCFVTLSFVQKFNSTPRVIISPSSAAAGGLDYYTNRSTTSFSICSASAPAAGSNYVFDYIVFD